MRPTSAHLLIRSVLLAGLVLVFAESDAFATRRATPPSDGSTPALEAATKQWKALALDRKARTQKSWWVKSVAKLEKAAEGSCPTPIVALSRAASACEQAATFGVVLGAERCEKAWVRAAESCPADRQADDAWLAAATLAKSGGRVADARKFAELAEKVAGDRLKDAREFLSALSPAPKSKPVEKVAAARKVDRAVTRERAPVVPKTKEIEAVRVSVAPPAPTAHAAHDEAHGEFDALPEHLEASGVNGDSFDRLGDLLAAMDVLAEPGRRTAAAETLKQVKKSVVSTGGMSLSEQVGLKVRRVVVDAGHGGHDTGAIGPTGINEKDVTLAIARTLADQLRARGYEVVLTRDSDVFLALEERTAYANKERGDLFISVHANAHKSRKKGGIETYSLNVTGDRYARRLAARENATTERTVSDLQFLLADLAVRANTADSRRLASLVQTEVVTQTKKSHGALRDLGTKQALFFVLLGARMPSILVETAFLSNPAEEKKLADEKFQGTVARAIADGVDAFVQRRTELASSEW